MFVEDCVVEIEWCVNCWVELNERVEFVVDCIVCLIFMFYKDYFERLVVVEIDVVVECDCEDVVC